MRAPQAGAATAARSAPSTRGRGDGGAGELCSPEVRTAMADAQLRRASLVSALRGPSRTKIRSGNGEVRPKLGGDADARGRAAHKVAVRARRSGEATREPSSRVSTRINQRQWHCRGRRRPPRRPQPIR